MAPSSQLLVVYLLHRMQRDLLLAASTSQLTRAVAGMRATSRGERGVVTSAPLAGYQQQYVEPL